MNSHILSGLTQQICISCLLSLESAGGSTPIISVGSTQSGHHGTWLLIVPEEESIWECSTLASQCCAPKQHSHFHSQFTGRIWSRGWSYQAPGRQATRNCCWIDVGTTTILVYLLYYGKYEKWWVSLLSWSPPEIVALVWFLLLEMPEEDYIRRQPGSHFSPISLKFNKPELSL